VNISPLPGMTTPLLTNHKRQKVVCKVVDNRTDNIITVGRVFNIANPYTKINTSIINREQ